MAICAPLVCCRYDGATLSCFTVKCGTDLGCAPNQLGRPGDPAVAVVVGPNERIVQPSSLLHWTMLPASPTDQMLRGSLPLILRCDALSLVTLDTSTSSGRTTQHCAFIHAGDSFLILCCDPNAIV